MATAVEMPKLGNTVEDCLLAVWLKHKGDTVVAGDVIAEIETDKTSFELTAPVDGVILGTFFAEGALVPVFTPICAIGSAGESVDEFSPVPKAGPGAGAAPCDGTIVPNDRPDGGQERAGAVTKRTSPEDGPVVPVTTAVAPGVAEAYVLRAPASPRARRFGREHDFYPGSLEGSGPGGRVLEADLRRAWHSSPRASAAVRREQVEMSLPEKDRLSSTSGTARGPHTDVLAVHLSSVREKIGKRLRESLASTVQYTLHSSANAGGLLALRKKLKASPVTEGVNINDLVVFCTVRALLEVPDLNAELIDGVVHRHTHIHMGFACDTPRGLVVPVVHDSESLSLVGLSRQIKEHASRAVQGSITVDDLNGGTFTVSNLGSLGVESFTPLLNPPQVAILGVDAIGLKPTRKPDGNIEFIDSIGLSLTLDHQVVDGAPGARFLAVLRDKIEHAELICTT